MYAYAHRYCPDYTGGFWQFYLLPDGGGFIAPDVESLTLCNADNWFEQTVSREVAWIILTALVLNHLEALEDQIREWSEGTDNREGY